MAAGNNSYENSHCPRIGFYLPFATKRTQGSMGNWLIPERGQGKYRMNLEHHVVPKSKKVLDT